MKTVDALYEQYGEKHIPAGPAIAKYFGFGTVDEPVTARKITQLISKKRLHGLRPIRMSKTLYIVNIENLAEVLDDLERA